MPSEVRYRVFDAADAADVWPGLIRARPDSCNCRNCG